MGKFSTFVGNFVGSFVDFLEFFDKVRDKVFDKGPPGDPIRWTDLDTVHLRLRAGEDVVFWVRFSEATRTLSMLEVSGVEFGPEQTFGSGYDVLRPLLPASPPLNRHSPTR